MQVAIDELDAVVMDMRRSETSIHFRPPIASSTPQPLPSQVMFYVNLVQKCFPRMNGGLSRTSGAVVVR